MTVQMRVGAIESAGPDLYLYSRYENYRDRADAFDRRHRRERAIDAALADSFPASDPPAWTLGVSRNDAADTGRDPARVVIVSGGRGAKLEPHRMIASFAGASVLAVLFAVAILAIGSLLAVGIRALVEMSGVAANWLSSLAGIF